MHTKVMEHVAEHLKSHDVNEGIVEKVKRIDDTDHKYQKMDHKHPSHDHSNNRQGFGHSNDHKEKLHDNENHASSFHKKRHLRAKSSSKDKNVPDGTPEFAHLMKLKDTQPSPYLKKVDLDHMYKLFREADVENDGKITSKQLKQLVLGMVKEGKITADFAQRRLKDLKLGVQSTFGEFVGRMTRLDTTGLDEMKEAVSALAG